MKRSTKDTCADSEAPDKPAYPRNLILDFYCPLIHKIGLKSYQRTLQLSGQIARSPHISENSFSRAKKYIRNTEDRTHAPTWNNIFQNGPDQHHNIRISFMLCATLRYIIGMEHYAKFPLPIRSTRSSRPPKFPDHAKFPLPIRSTRSSRPPKFPDKARPSSTEFVYTASSRPLLDHTRPHTIIHDSCSMSTRQLLRSLLDHPDRYKIPTRSLVDQLDRCSISTRPLPDQIVMVVY